MTRIKKSIGKLKAERTLSDEAFLALMACEDSRGEEYLFAAARGEARARFSNQVYMRGLIEFTSYCKNDCLYCGIRKSNRCAERYRLEKEEILDCCDTGYALGFRTFVLQGGEDPWYTADRMADILSSVKAKYPDCALTLSFGEHGRETFRRYRDAGADRYLLRHETADEEHYKKLHPPDHLSLKNRKECLFVLKELGFQVGAGFMVGSPWQTPRTILKDIRFLEELRPHMLGVGPYLPHRDTPFAGREKGSAELTLRLIAMLRLMLPDALIPATTALGVAVRDGMERGILAGANVLMPNLSPSDARKKYSLYDGKISAGEGVNALQQRMEKIGYTFVAARGDYRET